MVPASINDLCLPNSKPHMECSCQTALLSRLHAMNRRSPCTGLRQVASDKRSCVSSSCEEECRWDEERRCNVGLSMELEASSEANDRTSARPVDFTRLIGQHCSILRFSEISNTPRETEAISTEWSAALGWRAAES